MRLVDSYEMCKLIDVGKLREFFKVRALNHKRFAAKKKVVDDNADRKDDDDDDDDRHDGGNDGDHQAAPEQVQIPSINVTEVIEDDDEHDDAVDSAGHELDATGQQIEDQAEQVFNASEKENEFEKEGADEQIAADEDNLPLNSGIEVLGRETATDDDVDVPLSLKYHTTPQVLIPVDVDVEIIGVNHSAIEMDDNNLTFIENDGVSYGIED
ncbi:hypothetical protein Dimus_003007, partial [Dionaea muscipula]